MSAMRIFIAVLVSILFFPPIAAIAQDYSLGGGRYKKCLDKVATDPQGALQAFRYWREVDEWDGGPALHCEALILTALKQYGDAARRLEEIVALDLVPDATQKATILGQAGNAWILAERGDLALATLNRAIEMNDQDFDLVMDRARAHALLENWESAIADLSAIIGVAKPNADHLVLRATAYRHQKKYSEARGDIDAALGISVNHGGALLERGILRQIGGDNEGARQDWVMVVTTNPDTSVAEAAQSRLQQLDLKTGQAAPSNNESKSDLD